MISFAPHFTLAEFVRASDRVPDAIEEQKAARLSQLDEIIRHALGDVPLPVTSWIRTGDAGAHDTGDGNDVRPRRDLSQREIVDLVTDALRAAGVQFGELIFYPFSDWHIHITLYPVGGMFQILVADAAEKVYVALDAPGVLDSIPTTRAPFPPATVANGAAVLLGAVVLAAVAGAVLA